MSRIPYFSNGIGKNLSNRIDEIEENSQQAPHFWRFSNDDISTSLAASGGVLRQSFFEDTMIKSSSLAENEVEITPQNGVVKINQEGFFSLSCQASFQGNGNADVLQFANLVIFYTTDGTTPDASSSVLVRGESYLGWNDNAISGHISVHELRFLEESTKLRVMLEAYAANNQAVINILPHTAVFTGHKIA